MFLGKKLLFAALFYDCRGVRISKTYHKTDHKKAFLRKQPPHGVNGNFPKLFPLPFVLLVKYVIFAYTK